MRDYKVPAEIPQPDRRSSRSDDRRHRLEVTRFTVITTPKTDEKMLIAGLACCPLAAIVDYELTLSMPLRLTADTGPTA